MTQYVTVPLRLSLRIDRDAEDTPEYIKAEALRQADNLLASMEPALEYGDICGSIWIDTDGIELGDTEEED